ncbi:MAG: family finger-like protein [Myxococcales bacterium]|nr:family finger-like protein [Myxococcales bacterium]
MKFLCDRCKTRYSIGDDRVRGKILKIRCKNCANVITVREGMTDEGAVDDVAARRGRPTTAAPNASYTTMAGNGTPGALGAAFANQMTKPPAALEEEWYVSIDGDQAGPFSLADAQRWVGSKAWDADLHCWSEGFDDWLPVDKVSHFRNLRKKPPAPQAPPPLPRVGGGGLRAQPAEEDPKPLFAATMASLEKASDPKVALPPIGSAATVKGAAIAKTNGSAAPAIPLAAKPQPTAKGTASVPAAAAAKPAQRAGTVPGVGLTAGAAALAAAFDASDDGVGDSLTAVETPVFNEEVATTAEPVAAKRAFERDPAPGNSRFPGSGSAINGARAAAVAPDRMPVPRPMPQSVADALEDDDNLDIGEVSRVVNLADLARPGGPRKVARAPLRGGTGAVARISSAELGPLGAPQAETALGPPLLDQAGESVLAAPAVAQRRGTIMLLAFAAVLLLGVTGAVILLVTSSGNDDLPMGLGHSSKIDTSRPEDIRRGQTDNGPGSGSSAPVVVRRTCPPFCGPRVSTGKGSAEIPEVATDPTLKRLEASEIEDMAAKQGDGTRRCYMRAQKGALGIEIGDLKKIAVTLSVDKDGLVTDVQLSEHGADALGKCLVARIKGWKFRVSPGGTYRFSLAFSSG